MPGVFLSHSSLDKPFVFRLADDLTIRGMPVWLDSWELDIGDSLYDGIFDGIDSGTFLVLCLSSNVLESKWAMRELKAALAKEDRIGRKVILPIKIGECEPPLSIADRLYVDFTKGYLRGLEQLESLLRRHGVDKFDVPFERRLLPLVFAKGLFLDQVNLQAQYANLVPQLRSGSSFSSKQFVISPDPDFDEMYNVLRTALETIQNRVDYSPELDRELKTTYAQIQKMEAAIPEGIAAIANGIFSINDWAFFSEAAHWYARITRSEVLARLLQVWKSTRDSDAPLGQQAVLDVIGTPKNAAKFWGTDSMFSCDLFHSANNKYFKIWVKRISEVGSWFEENPQIPVRVKEFWSPELMYQFVFPQIVSAHFYYYPSKDLVWKLEDWMIGAG